MQDSNNDMAFRDEVTRLTIDMFGRKQHGHMGEIAYQNGGGELFEAFVQNNRGYYPYHGEIDHITANRKAIAEEIGDTEHVIVVGPGPASSFSKKDFRIIELLPNLKSVDFIDLSESFNRQSAAAMEEFARSRDIEIKTHKMDFRTAGDVLQIKPKTTVISTGALVGNVHNVPLNGFPNFDMEDMLRGFRKLAGDDGYVVLGYDSNSNHKTLKSSYNEDLAPFFLNLLKTISSHCHGLTEFNPDPDHFRYEMEWLEKSHQVVHKLVVTRPQTFKLQTGDTLRNGNLETGNEFIVMSSLKPPTGKMSELGQNIGLETCNIYVDRNGLAEHVFKTVASDKAEDGDQESSETKQSSLFTGLPGITLPLKGDAQAPVKNFGTIFQAFMRS